MLCQPALRLLAPLALLSPRPPQLTTSPIVFFALFSLKQFLVIHFGPIFPLVSVRNEEEIMTCFFSYSLFVFHIN